MSLNLEVQILGEYKSLSKATKGASRQLYSLQNTTKKISRSINATLGTIGVGLSLGAVFRGMKSMINQASELEQSLGATEAVFGDFSSSIIANSKKAAKSFGLSANDYLQSTNLIGAQLKNLGLSTEEYAKKADNLVGLGADLAATFGGTTYDAVQALSAVFRGEYNQVEKYGISIRKSDINARVAETSQRKLTGAMLKQAEALAGIDILYEQTTASQGQFARESNTMAGSMQIMKAAFSTISTTIGEAFIPAIVSFSTWMIANIPQIQALADAIAIKLQAAFTDTGNSAQTFGAKVITAITDLTSFLNGTAETGNVFYDISEKMKPFLDLIGAFGELGKGLIEVLNGLFDGLFGWIGLLSGGEATVGGFAGFVKFLGEVLQNVGYWIGIVISFFIPFGKGFAIAGEVISKFGGIVGKMLGGADKVVRTALSGVVKFIEGVITTVQKLLGIKVENAVLKAGDAAAGAAKGFGAMDDAASRAIKNQGKFADAISKIPAVAKKADKGLGALRSGIGAVGGAIAGATGKPTKPLYSGPMIDPKTGKSLIPKTNTGTGETAAQRKARLAAEAKAKAAAERAAAKAKADAEAAAAKKKAEEDLQLFKDRVQKLVDTVKDALADAKQRIKSASESFRDAVGVSFGIITNGAFEVFDVDRVIRKMKRLVESSKNFASDLEKLRLQGADQALIDELIGLGPGTGSTAASNLLSSGKLSEYLGLRTQLGNTGAAAGAQGNLAEFGVSVDDLTGVLTTLNKTLEEGAGQTYNINITNAANMSANDIIAAIKKYEKTAGKKVFSN